MMTNLFSIFDPSSSVLSMSWLTIMIPMIFLVNTMWKKVSNLKTTQKVVLSKFKSEVSYALGKTTKGTETLLLLMFMVILPMNLVALYPQNFSPTAHLPITLPLSLTVWASIMMFGWLKNTKHMLSHLLPQGTPVALMNFMVLIELTSNLIRPITLCVRLTANLIAGHLLMSLLGNAIMSMTLTNALIALPAPLILTILETAVACIQAYVFMTLITLYTTELN